MIKIRVIKALEIKTVKVFRLCFTNNTIMLFPFFLIIDLHFLIPAVIAKIFNPTAELVIPTKTPTIEAKS